VRRHPGPEEAVKILAINGSHRGGRGATQYLIDLVAEGARAAGASFDDVALARQKIQRCLGCFACETRHPLRCVWDGKDDVAAIFQRMREADLLVLATPVYVFGLSSLLKAFLERLKSTSACAQFRVTRSGLFFHHVDAQLCGKPFVALVCCDNLEDETPRNALDYFRTYSRFSDAPLVGRLVRPTAQGLMLARGPEGARRYPRAEEVVAAWREAGRELAREGRISRATERRASRSILEMPALVRLLMRLDVRAVKEQAVRRAQGLFPVAPPEGAGADEAPRGPPVP
jgi:multimeric flavodoxin WrbA